MALDVLGPCDQQLEHPLSFVGIRGVEELKNFLSPTYLCHILHKIQTVHTLFCMKLILAHYRFICCFIVDTSFGCFF